jgi:hypothetical protein
MRLLRERKSNDVGCRARSAAGQSARPASPQGQSKDSMAFGKPLRVLIVDGEPSTCKALATSSFELAAGFQPHLRRRVARLARLREEAAVVPA